MPKQNNRRWLNHSAWALVLLLPFTTLAGQDCEVKALDALTAQRAFELAYKTQQTLQQLNVEAAFIARVGQDLSKYGLHYSHFGWVKRNADGHYNIVHLLNDCGSDQSDIYIEGLANFLLDDVHQFEVMLIVPDAQLQQQLKTALAGPLPKQMHTPDYSLLAYPFATEYQNSNQWGLELLAAVKLGQASSSRKVAQAYLEQAGFVGDYVAVDPLKRIGAGMFKANVSFTDHPLRERLKGSYQFVSVESAERFLLKLSPTSQKVVLKE